MQLASGEVSAAAGRCQQSGRSMAALLNILVQVI